MVRYLLLTLTCLLVGATAAMSQTSLRGKVVDDTGEPVILGNVALKKNGVLITGANTDFDGFYSITDIDPGTYEVEFSYVGLQTTVISGVRVNAGKSNTLDVTMAAEGINLEEVVVIGYEVPLIEQDNTTQGGTVTAEQINRLPAKNINAIVGNVAGTSSADEGDDITIKGSRSDNTVYWIDGVPVRGNLIPQTEIEQLQVITGGIAAQYGDVTGGVISITTKGPSSKFSGGVELETSEFLDPYGYNLAVANLSGPIIKNKETNQTIVGFRVSGQYRQRLDDDPPATQVFRVKDEVLAELEANPVVILGTSEAAAAQFLGDEAVDQMDFRPFEENTRLDLTAKLDFRLSQAIDLSVTGTYNYEKDFFTPNGSTSNAGLANWRVFNSHNNPFDEDTRYRAIARFRHRLGGQNASTGAEGEETASTSVIQNASYNLQVGYEVREYELGDQRHQDEFFNYGYIGQFDYEWQPAFGPPVDPATFPFPVQHRDFTQVFTGYTPNETINPVLANYNNARGEISSDAEVIARNGQISNLVTEVWNLHANVGSVYNLYRLRDQRTLNFNANSSFEIVPNGSENGRHSVQFGLWYEQRTERGYDLNPRALWLIGDQQANRNILGVDTSNVVGESEQFGFLVPVYGLQTTEIEDGKFYRSIRELTGSSFDEFVNINALTPDQLSLDMFSSRELTSQNILNYWGYDYLGNPVDVTFEEFFTTEDENGVRTFPVAAYRPVYTAAYIQDKFTFKDIIFRVGVRIDRFDANTQVLKDPYALYEIQGAADFHDNLGTDRPGTIGDDYKVYIESPESDVVKAYRNGDQWFFPNGTEANDGNLIFGGELVYPKYTVDDPNIQSKDFDPSISFEDYEQQTNIMPRLAFSFPISDEANFFAHYDVLVQRPPSNVVATALDYFYFQERTGIRNNPNLRPERTVDYEVGFQQKLSNSSAIKIAAYYKEMRDMIQFRTFLFVAEPIIQYDTYDNLDFGTVKGFTFQYDLRRTGNISMNIAYTLQFADGTGSDANSSRGLSNQGLQRVLYPLNFDERNRFNVSLDYRYGSGKKYNGPTLFGADIFANAGVNIQAIAVSGRPYTANLVPDILGGSTTRGSLNGARLPWNYTVNMRVDKDFNLSKTGNLGLNVYFRVSNLFDTRNIANVYPATGSPDDDGYLASFRGIDAQESAQAIGLGSQFVASYQWRMLNPTFFSLPRRMFVGAIFNF